MSKAFRLGLLIVAALFIFAVGIFWIGNNEMLFQSNYRLNAEFRNVAGLAGGAEVRVAGVRKGAVRRIDLPERPGQKVRVEMDLDSDTRRLVRNDSPVAIHAEGLMGDEYVEISMGSAEAPAVKDNETLEGEQPVEISDLIGKANGILDTAGGAMQSVGQTADSLSSIASKIDSGTGTVGALINDKKLYQNVNQSTTELQEDLEAAKHNFLLSHFFNKRGYEDSAEITKYEIGKLPARPAIRKFYWPARQIFDKPDTAKLKGEKALREAGAFLQSNPFGLAVVAGYSDMEGDLAKEKVLTEARAMVVRDYLVKNFKMDDTNVKTIGLGKSPDANAAGIAVLVYPTGTALPGPAAQSTGTTPPPGVNAQAVNRNQ
jgi:phospholipid/cholesterol/gamma-HCH transport system substrate-binding protein